MNLRSRTIRSTPDTREGPLVPSSTNASKPPVHYRPPAWLRHNTGQEVKTISKSDLIEDSVQVDGSSGFEVLCSYNWQDVSHPTICVPGAPPRWSQQDLPVTLPEDKAGRFIDQNAHRCPMYSFVPMFRAIEVMKPEFKFNEIDFITNRNSMRRLLDFVSGKVQTAFRIDLDMVQDTLIISRKERFTKEAVNDSRGNLGFGSNFEHRFTTHQPGLEASTGHHRVARYKFGDLDCAIRYEVDAYLAEDILEDEELEKASASTKHQHQAQSDLLSSLQALSLNAKEQENSTDGLKKWEVKVISGGINVDKTRLVELKTKAKAPVMAYLIPQLWFGRVPFLIVGRHQNGTFEKITTTETTEEFEKFERSRQIQLRKMVHLIRLLRQETMSSPNHACVVVCDPKIKPLQLSVLSVKSKRPILPPEVVKQHWTPRRS